MTTIVNANQNSQTAFTARMQAIISGLQKRHPNETFTLGNKAFTTAALVALFEEAIETTDKATASKASTTVAVAAMRTAKANAGPVFKDLKRWLQSTYGTAADTLGDFGLAPVKQRAPRTVEEKVATTAKARSTRQARGTKGKKQKLAVQGDVKGVVVTPITSNAPSSPSPSPQPASGNSNSNATVAPATK